ncbi:chorismate mutase [Dehalococcoidia bacterium]|nr:chorismate mutase [Dehalococcoidia bacterium]
MKVRGIRGATTVEENNREEILSATQEVLQEIISTNNIEDDDISAIFFTTTRDLNAEFPAAAARIHMGWTNAALMSGHEMDVPGSPQKCIRVLMLVNTEKTSEQIKHIYLRGAANLRVRGLEEKN